MSSKAVATDLELGALTAWSPAQQAALYAQHLAQQAVQDEKEAAKKAAEEEKAKKKSKVKPEAISAGKVMDEKLKGMCPPLVAFLEKFGPAYVIFLAVLVLHALFLYSAPWYLRFLLPYPMIYGLPMYSTLASVYSGKDRPLWQAYWVEVAVIEYFELVLFRDKVRSLTWWPVVSRYVNHLMREMKACFCIMLFSAVETTERKTSRKDRAGEQIVEKTQVFGAIKLIKPFLPPPEPEFEPEKPEKTSSERSSSSSSKNPKEDVKRKAHEASKRKAQEEAKKREASKKPAK